MMNAQRLLPITLLLLVSAFIAYFISISEGFHGGGDSLAHFRIAKFSWEHPLYLLDHWGKPFFTLLAMPFAQFGFKGIQFFNLLCGMGCALLVMALARHHRWTFGWLAVPIVMFAPIFMEEFFSGLTEASFALLLLLALLLRLNKHHVASLLLLSLLPHVRTEAVLLLIWFGALDLFERRSWQSVLLLAGTIVYSLIGWVAKGDPFWLITEMPYSGGEHIYGSGSLFHYVQIMPASIGINILILSVIGLLFSLPGTITGERDAKWLMGHVVVPIIIYVGFHSIMWYVGRVSLGLPRMLAVIVPLLALLAVYAFHRFQGLLPYRLAVNFLCVAAAVLILANGLRRIELPVRLGQEEIVLNEVADYIRTNQLTHHKIHYYSLYNEVALGLDPHNEAQCQQVIHTRAEPQKGVAAGSLVIWDSHYAPNEGAMPLENLVSSPYFEVLHVFRPQTPFNTLGNRPYEVYLFLRKDMPASNGE